jgi:hypothetical protein
MGVDRRQRDGLQLLAVADDSGAKGFGSAAEHTTAMPGATTRSSPRG